MMNKEKLKESLDIVNKCDFIISISKSKEVKNDNFKILKNPNCLFKPKQR